MVTLGCLEKKTNGYSFVVQYSLMDERRKLFELESDKIFSCPTWLIFSIETPNHGSRARFWVSCWR